MKNKGPPAVSVAGINYIYIKHRTCTSPAPSTY